MELRRARKRLVKLLRTEQHLDLAGTVKEKCATTNNKVISTEIKSAFAMYDKCYRHGWEYTFVGCCHDRHGGVCSKCKPPSRFCMGANSNSKRDTSDDEKAFRCKQQSKPDPHIARDDSYDDMSAFTTQFNVTALVPSVRRLYVDLWDTIELSLLGYYDADKMRQDQWRQGNGYSFILIITLSIPFQL